MHVYIVGGAVRDQFLKRPVKDKDYVVVGVTPQHMLNAGFTQVGSDFPVFLHPKTKAEYALARTERKSGKGYKGFEVYAAPDVTIEQDLKRRDLTINAMAIEVCGLHDDTPITGNVIDPYGGRDDIASKTLRHVSSAFSEDPLRVLRIARFYSRFYNNGTATSNFTIAPETVELIKSINESGELAHLTAERVWLETRRAIMQDAPHAYFKCLIEIGALPYLFPTLAETLSNGFIQKFVFHALSLCGDYHLPLAKRWAVLQMSYMPEKYLALLGFNKSNSFNSSNSVERIETSDEAKIWTSKINHLSVLLTTPKSITQFATLFANMFADLANLENLNAQTLTSLINLTKAHKDSITLDALINTFYVVKTAYIHCQFEQIIGAYNKIGMDNIDSNLEGRDIGNALNSARSQAIDSFINKN